MDRMKIYIDIEICAAELQKITELVKAMEKMIQETRI